MYIKFYMNKNFGIKFLTAFFIFSLVSFSCLGLCFNSSQEKNSNQGVKLPVLMYHLVSKNHTFNNKFVVSSEIFEQDLKYIKENGYTTILVQDLINFTEGKQELPKKPILITFDDGAYNNYLYAFPLAKKYGAKFVFSPIAKETEKYSQVIDENPSYAHANWKCIEEMSKSGLVEIQNHTYDMHKTKSLRHGCTKKSGESKEIYKQKLSEDLIKAQNLIEHNTGVKPTAFFYPYGACSSCSGEIIKSLGFKATFLCESKVNYIEKTPESLFNLKRFLRPPNVSSTQFFSQFEK